MTSKVGFSVGGVVVCPTSRCKDGANVNTAVQALLTEGKLLELIETVKVGRTTAQVSDAINEVDWTHYMAVSFRMGTLDR